MGKRSLTGCKAVGDDSGFRKAVRRTTPTHRQGVMPSLLLISNFVRDAKNLLNWARVIPVVRVLLCGYQPA